MRWVRFLVFTLLAAVALAPAWAAERQTISHEFIWKLKRVGTPVPSPDGRWVVVSVTEPDYDPDKQVSDLWILPPDGSAPPRRLTFSKGSENGVAWSPDSRKIAFSAKRDGDKKPQIYVLDIGGGEAVRITDMPLGATHPKWSPDGKKILFQSTVYPGAYDPETAANAAEEREKRKYKAYVYDGFPIRYWDRWLDDSRQHLFVQEARAGAEPVNLLAGSKLAEQPGFGGPRTLSGENFRAVWSPDGKSVVFTATVNRHEAAYAVVITHLYKVPAAGGEPEDLTPGKDSYFTGKFSPDGRFLYALRRPVTDYVYNLTRLVRMRWPGGEPQVLTGAFDRSVSSYAVAPGGERVYLQADDQGVTKIFRMPAAGGAPEAIVDPAEGTYSGLAVPAKAAGDLVLATWQSYRRPAEVVRVDPAAKNHTALTAFNKDAVARIDAPPARHFWFTSRKGRRIHNLLFLPPGFDESKKYPLVLFIHGGPHSSSKDSFHPRWNFLLLTSPGYVVLATNYTGSVGFGEEFARAIQGDPLRTPGEEIDQAADEALKRFPFLDGSRMAAGGASYGGHLSNWLQATTSRYRCLYSHAGLISLEGQWATSDVIYHRERNNGGPPWEGSPIWKEQSPFTYAKNFKTPVLLTIGVKDYRVPLNQTLAYWSVLQRLRVPSRLVVFPRANHWIQNGEDNRYFYQELLGWLEKYLSE